LTQARRDFDPLNAVPVVACDLTGGAMAHPVRQCRGAKGREAVSVCSGSYCRRQSFIRAVVRRLNLAAAFALRVLSLEIRLGKAGYFTRQRRLVFGPLRH